MGLNKRLNVLRALSKGIPEDVVNAVFTEDRPLKRNLDIYGYKGEVIGTVSCLMRKHVLNDLTNLMWRKRYE